MIAIVNYYEILQVSPNADHEVIKAAYRRLAQIHHPDNGGSEEKMRLLNEAYEILSDPGKRKEYDNLLREFYRQFYIYYQTNLYPENQNQDIQTESQETLITKAEAEIKNTSANWAIGLGILCIFLGADIGLLNWVTVIVSIIAIDKANKIKVGMAKSLIGLVLGILFALVNAHKYGHI